jgi:3-hydroxy-5-phosphonooxypentane-2,4-dione thiolase
MNFGESNWGKKNRLAQIFRRNNQGQYHTVMLAFDHPYFQGPIEGLVDPRKTIRPLVPYADAISPAKGTLEYCLDPLVPTPVILRITGGNSMTRKEELSDEHVITSVEEAVKLNAVGVSVSVYIGTPHQAQTLKNLGTVANEASKYGLVVLGITAVGADLEKRVKGEGGKEHADFDPGRYFAHAGRIIQENGADIVKTYYCKNFDLVRQGVQVPIVIAGGKKIPEREALDFTYNAVKSGAEGVDMGRNIFQAANPIAMLTAIRAIVHDAKSSEEAHQIYQDSLSK